MTFTYNMALAANKDKVRFHIGDTDPDAHYLEDETITALLASEGSIGGAVIASIRYILARLSQPNFRADWLQVDHASARKGYEALLAEKRREFGLSAVSSSVTHTYRADSAATEEPDYSGGAGLSDGTRYIVIEY